MTEPRRLARVGAALRDAWLVAGICIAIMLTLEFGYRALQGLHGLVLSHPTMDARSPYAKQPWYRVYAADDTASMIRLAWQPYTEFRRAPFRSTWVNVDSTGLRRTVNPTAAASARHVVFAFGGSTMWGTGQRDSMTIASLIAADLAARGVPDAEVVNFGQTGFIFTQQVFDLTLALRAGARPSVVVFYNGINDAAASVQNGEPGIPINDFHRARDFDMGHVLFNPQSTPASESRALLRMALIAASRSSLLRRFQPAGHLAPERSPDSLANDIARSYWATAELVEALADRYGFTVFYFWQPVLHNTLKPLTPFERSLRASIDADANKRRLLALHARMPARIAAGATNVPGRFTDLTGLFAHDTAGVYIDDIGHVTEAANVVIADTITSVLLTRVREKL